MQSTIRSKATSIFNTIRSSILGQAGQRTRETLDLELSSKTSIPSGAPPVWEIAARFFVANTRDTMPMEVDDCSQQYVEQGLDGDHDRTEHTARAQDNEDELDEAEEAGTSDHEGHGGAQDDEKDCRWKPPCQRTPASRPTYTQFRPQFRSPDSIVYSAT
jgi:hypothetical protein